MGTVSEADLGKVRQHMSKAKAPQRHDKVYKDECMFSFDTPESPGGLYIGLTSFQGFGAEYVALNYERTREALYLHERWTRVPLPEPEPDAIAAAAAATGNMQLALGGPRHTFDKAQSLVVLGADGKPDLEIPLPCPDLPEVVLRSIAGINAHESVSKQEATAVWEEERRVSKYADNLPQLEPTRKISPNPKDWRCDETGVTENLWLNLSTGFIGSGRKNWDGSGGNGAALRHYEATGKKYPLVVKLGTITPHGADVYSYAGDEDDMVQDPHLAKHLAHWGINMMQMEKTEASMAELQVQLNTSYEFSRILEGNGKSLKPVSGPGFTGLINLGNSCYMNSVLQVLYSLPEVAERYGPARAADIFKLAPPDPATDLGTQLAKVGVALTTGRTGLPPPGADGGAQAMDVDGKPTEAPLPEATAVRPVTFKSLVGKGHPEFSTGRQQDVAEYLLHLLDQIQRFEHGNGKRVGVQPLAPGSTHSSLGDGPLRSAFTFQAETRMQCTATGAVSYRTGEQVTLGLHIPEEAAVNREEVEAHKDRAAKRARMQAESASAYIGAGANGATGDQVHEVTLAGDEGVASEFGLGATTQLASTAGGQKTAAKEPPASTNPELDGAAAAAAAGVSAAGPTSGGVALTAGAGEAEEKVLPKVPFSACLNLWAADEEVPGYISAAAGGRKVTALKRTRFATFPQYLVIAMQRYYTDASWVPRKLEVSVELPQSLDLSHLRGQGLQPGEVPQPKEAEGAAAAAEGAAAGGAASTGGAAAAAATPNPELVASLASMGFGENACARAALAVDNSGVEAAMEWLLGHLEDENINDPLAPPASAAAAAGGAAPPAGGGDEVSPEALSSLTSMGFTDDQAKAALKACGGNVERAGDWLFSHMDDLDSAVAQVLSEAQAASGPAAAGGAAAAGSSTGAGASSVMLDGPGKYEMVAIISHLGSNTACGHYVAHVKKGGKWYIFNDEKVAESEAPPLDLGYVYLYRRAAA